jgi:hypothetical protein
MDLRHPFYDALFSAACRKHLKKAKKCGTMEKI